MLDCFTEKRNCLFGITLLIERAPEICQRLSKPEMEISILVVGASLPEGFNRMPVLYFGLCPVGRFQNPTADIVQETDVHHQRRQWPRKSPI